MALDKITREIAADIDGFYWNKVDMEDMSEDEEFYPEEEEQSDEDESNSEEEEITNEHNLDEDVMETLSATHIVVAEAYLEKLRKDSKKLRRLEKVAFGGKQYNGTNLGKRFMCAVMVQNPSLSFILLNKSSL